MLKKEILQTGEPCFDLLAGCQRFETQSIHYLRKSDIYKQENNG
jgi:hypothetical protein